MISGPARGAGSVNWSQVLRHAREAIRPGLQVVQLQDQRVLTGSVVVLPGAELLKTKLLVERNRRLVVVRDIQDHRAYPQLPHGLQARANKISTDPLPTAAGFHHQAMKITKLTNGGDRDHPDRMLRPGDQDRATLTKKFATPAALAPLLSGGKPACSNIMIAERSSRRAGENADLRIA